MACWSIETNNLNDVPIGAQTNDSLFGVVVDVHIKITGIVSESVLVLSSAVTVAVTVTLKLKIYIVSISIQSFSIYQYFINKLQNIKLI